MPRLTGATASNPVLTADPDTTAGRVASGGAESFHRLSQVPLSLAASPIAFDKMLVHARTDAPLPAHVYLNTIQDRPHVLLPHRTSSSSR